MDADIVCVGFGPATAGFLSTLSKQLLNADGTPAVESAVAPGLPPQVLATNARTTSASAFPASSPKRAPYGRAFPILKRPASPWPPASAKRKCSTFSTRWREPAFGPARLADQGHSRIQMGAPIRA